MEKLEIDNLSQEKIDFFSFAAQQREEADHFSVKYNSN